MIRVTFSKPRSVYVAVLIAGLLGFAYLIRMEQAEGWSPWVFLNYELPEGLPEPPGWILFYPMMRIASFMLAGVAIIYSGLRLFCMPSWLSAKIAGVAVIVASAVWFAVSVYPYSSPEFDHMGTSEFRILHVQKRGLQFHESEFIGSRDGRVITIHNDRRLFQYRFQQRVARTVSTEPIATPHFLNLETASPHALRSWNAEGWYVILQNTRLLAFTTENQRTPPREITELFDLLSKREVTDYETYTVRDVCLGFCYDPIAGLGYITPRQRARLLHGASSY